jgi:hypothetical protein
MATRHWRKKSTPASYRRAEERPPGPVTVYFRCPTCAGDHPKAECPRMRALSASDSAHEGHDPRRALEAP